MRAVIDTNVIIAGMKSTQGASHAILLAIAAQAPYIVTSNVRDVRKACSLGIQVLEPREFIRILPSP